ncbi:MAG TPA: papain-like cysteine protease family protein [Acidobacteriaceae bacterium]|jgi:hypothetical protein
MATDEKLPSHLVTPLTVHTGTSVATNIPPAANKPIAQATPVAVQLVTNRQSLVNTAAMLQAVPQTSILRSVNKISISQIVLPIRFPPIHLNTIAYTLPLGSAFHTAQGQAFAVSVHFNLSGPATPINFTYSGLPAGVAPVTTVVNFAANASRRIFLNFSVTHSTPLQSSKSFVIHYSGYNGAQKADIPLTLEINTGFDMQHQLESNWCWAGVSTSVAHFYNPSSTVTQCQVVNNQLGRSDCCSNGGSSNCNQSGYLDKALNFVGHLDHVDSSTETYATVVNQVSVWHPFGIRVAWSGGGAHFIAATGYEQGQLLVIQDPIYGTSVVSYATMFGSYQGSGNWTHSYFTKP